MGAENILLLLFDLCEGLIWDIIFNFKLNLNLFIYDNKNKIEEAEY